MVLEPTFLSFPRRAVIASAVAFFLPAAFFLLLVLEDLLHLGLADKPGTSARVFGWLLYLVPSLGLILSCYFALRSAARPIPKVVFVVAALVGMILQCGLLFVTLGFFYMSRHGLEGVF